MRLSFSILFLTLTSLTSCGQYSSSNENQYSQETYTNQSNENEYKPGLEPTSANQLAREELLSDTENAYNPIPSPDGSMIAYVRTGRWEKGSGGVVRSNLRSEIMVMSSDGRIITETPLAETFLVGWTPESKHLVCYRSNSYFLVSLDRTKSKQVEIPYEHSSHTRSERGAYLPSADAMIFVEELYKSHRRVGGTIRTIKDVIARNNSNWLGEMIVPSPDGRYIAAIDVKTWADNRLWVFDNKEKSWANLGIAIIHPEITAPNNSWDWINAIWNPWFADSSRLAFISTSGIIISSPDGKSKQMIEKPKQEVGLAVPSPDGKLIAYVTFDPRSMKQHPDLKFWGGSTIWVVPTDSRSKARPVTEKNADTTYCLAWLNNRELVFDRIADEWFYTKARLWKVNVSD